MGDGVEAGRSMDEDVARARAVRQDWQESFGDDEMDGQAIVHHLLIGFHIQVDQSRARPPRSNAGDNRIEFEALFENGGFQSRCR